MKGWLVGLALLVVVVASGAGLWITWESTQSTTPEQYASAANRSLVTATTSSVGPATTTTTIPAPPACEVGDELITTDPTTEWATTVIDTGRRLPEDYRPPDLVDATEAGFESRDQVRTIVIEDLTALRTAAEANGTPIVVISGYRSFSYQANLFFQRASQIGAEAAALHTAHPGHSEHQLGTAIDVLDPGVGELTTAFGDTPAGRWIADHAHEYGFVVSYPEGARDSTCYEYEPWHLRYVGRDVAAEIHESGVTARAWMLAPRAPTGGVPG
ncbi:MAG TPA: M15 family metallopeptidase [Acidimicrobiales bacterium]|nr:M15 family metallopeptidase [Acidimicrobiales bacterium]